MAEAITEKGLTQASVARAAGILRSTFYQRLRNESPFYGYELGALGEVLGVSPSELVSRDIPADALILPRT